MLKISTLKDKFVINHNSNTTVIPFSELISFTFFQHQDQKIYESEVNFVAEEKLDGFIVSPEKHNGKFINNFYSISKKNPFEHKTATESNPFTTIDNPAFIEVQARKDSNWFIHYINLDYFTGFDIVADFDKNPKDSDLFKVKLDEALKIESKTLELETYIVLYVGDQKLKVDTECFVKALENIKNPSKKVLDILGFIKKTLVNNNVAVLK